MKNLFLLAGLVGIFSLQACMKDWNLSDTPSHAEYYVPPATYVPNYWQMVNSSGTLFCSPKYTFRMRPSLTDTAITAWDRLSTPGLDPNVINSCMIAFKTFPTANGTYRVVAYPTSGSLSSNSEVYIVAKIAGNTPYVSTGAGNINVTVTITSGKLSIVVPDIPMTHATLTPVTFSGTLGEL